MEGEVERRGGGKGGGEEGKGRGKEGGGVKVFVFMFILFNFCKVDYMEFINLFKFRNKFLVVRNLIKTECKWEF